MALMLAKKVISSPVERRSIISPAHCPSCCRRRHSSLWNKQLAESRIDTNDIKRCIGNDDGLPSRPENHGCKLLLSMDPVSFYRQRSQLRRVLDANRQHIAPALLGNAQGKTAKYLATAGGNRIETGRRILRPGNRKLPVAPAQITCLVPFEIIHPIYAEQESIAAGFLQHEGANSVQR
jgi:hypothetical protein